MSVPPEIQTLANRLNQAIDEIDREATQGANLIRDLLSSFPGNAILTQYFAYFNTALFFAETSKGQIQAIMETIAPRDIPNQIIQEAGEDLGSLLGKVLEVKLKVRRLMARLEE
jgi:hypothetical protein